MRSPFRRYLLSGTPVARLQIHGDMDEQGADMIRKLLLVAAAIAMPASAGTVALVARRRVAGADSPSTVR